MAFAQKGFEVKGTVLDNEGNPAIGAAVQDLSNGAASIVDFEGHFSLVASSSTAELTISSLGMNTQVIPLNGRAQLTITLSVSEDFLEEAVVTALGIKRSDRALGYAVAEVKGDDVMQATTIILCRPFPEKWLVLTFQAQVEVWVNPRA